MALFDRLEHLVQRLFDSRRPRLSATDPHADDGGFGGGSGGGGGGSAAAAAVPAVDRLEGEVVAVLGEFEQVHVRTAEGRVLAITPDTPGIDFASLHRGQRVACTVTRFLPRVLDAKVLA